MIIDLLQLASFYLKPPPRSSNPDGGLSTVTTLERRTRSLHSSSFTQHEVLAHDASVIRAGTAPWFLPVVCKMLSSPGSTASQWATYQHAWRHTLHGPTGFYFRSWSVIKEAGIIRLYSLISGWWEQQQTIAALFHPSNYTAGREKSRGGRWLSSWQAREWVLKNNYVIGRKQSASMWRNNEAQKVRVEIWNIDVLDWDSASSGDADTPH